MDYVIILARRLRKLRYAPDAKGYAQLYRYLDRDDNVKTLRRFLEAELLAIMGVTVEVPVQRLDSVIDGTHPTLYYSMKSTDTFKDLLQQVGEYERIDPNDTKIVFVHPDEEYRGQHVSGKISGSSTPATTRLSTIPLNAKVVVCPTDGRLNWSEQPNRQLAVYAHVPNVEYALYGYETAITATTTVGQLKCQLLPVLGVHPAEQIVTLYDTQDILDDNTTIEGTGGVREVSVNFKEYTVPGYFTSEDEGTQFDVYALDSGATLASRIELDYNVRVTHMWLGTPTNPHQIEVTREPWLLYDFLIPHSDMYIYVDAEDVEEELETLGEE